MISEVAVPISICVVLPVAIVLIRAFTKINSENKRAEVIIKAIEADNSIDANDLAESLKKPRYSDREILNFRLLRGCIFTLVGLLLLLVGIINLLVGSDFSSDPVSVPMMFGGGSLAIGISYLIVYFVTRRQVVDSVEKTTSDR